MYLPASAERAIRSTFRMVVLLQSVALSLFQLKRQLYASILNEFFNQVVVEPLELMALRVRRVLGVKDVTRNAQSRSNHNQRHWRRMLFNQLGMGLGVGMDSGMARRVLSLEEVAEQTAMSNDTIHKNMVLVKLALVAFWMLLCPDCMLNQSQDYGAEPEADEDAEQPTAERREKAQT